MLPSLHWMDKEAANKYPAKPNNPESKIAKFAMSFYSDENLATILNGNCPEGFDPKTSWYPDN